MNIYFFFSFEGKRRGRRVMHCSVHVEHVDEIKIKVNKVRDVIEKKGCGT